MKWIAIGLIVLAATVAAALSTVLVIGRRPETPDEEAERIAAGRNFARKNTDDHLV